MLNSFGVTRILDLSIAVKLSLQESAIEFIKRKKEGSNLPVICSACPGLVDYLEAAHTQLLPHLSTIKSPQQVRIQYIILRDVTERRSWGLT